VSSQGPLFPTLVDVLDPTGWSNTDNLKLDDGSVATSTVSGQHIRPLSFGFSIPAGSTIDGIEVTIKRYADAGGVAADGEVTLVQDGISGGIDHADGAYTTTPTVETVGGPADLWGLTWTPSQINTDGTSGFGVSFTTSVAGGHTASIDYIAVKVYYTPSAFVAADTGAFSLNGQSVGLLAARRITAESGSFVLTGQSNNLLYGHGLVASVGAFTLTGQDVGLRAARLLAMGTGVFVLTGPDTALFKVGSYAMVASTGAFVLTGNAAGLLAARKITSESGAFTEMGQSVLFVFNHLIHAGTGVFNLTGLPLMYQMSAEVGRFVVNGQSAIFVFPKLVNCTAAASKVWEVTAAASAVNVATASSRNV